jgi:hypothetical protein
MDPESDPRRPLALRWPGMAALFTGVGLLAFLLAGQPLPLTLSVSAAVAATSAVALWARSPGWLRRRIRREVLAGLVAGLIAVVAYDAIRVGGAVLDPSPYDPMEAIRGFGRALLGVDTTRDGQLAAGMAFHVVNGLLFGVGFVSLVAGPRTASRRSWVLRGVAWALFLEAFQILLYPDWLGIVLIREFTVIATAAHIGYGVVLGLVARRILNSTIWRKPWQS